VNGLPRDVTGVGTAQEANEARDVIRGTLAPQRWNLAGMVCRLGTNPCRGDQARRDTVDGDAVRRQIVGERASQTDQSGLGRYHVRTSSGASVRGQATDVHDRAAPRRHEMR
jgi:hypothetical protein